MPTEDHALDEASLATRLATALGFVLDYVDAIPANVAKSFPPMPGFDRDWVEGLLAEARSLDAGPTTGPAPTP